MLTFTFDPLDRADAHRRDPAWLAQAIASPDARAVVLTGQGPLIADGAPLLLAPGGARAAGASGDPILLGLRDGTPLFALDVPGGLELDGLADDARVVDLRAAAAGMSAGDAGLLAHAAALVQWHRVTGFCARCGSPTVSEEAGHVRRCIAHGHQHFPRTDPVIIVLVTDGDRVVLGRQPSWPARRYSALAGFVEPGETLESAVARELREEARIEVSHIRYIASQPWPFPGSLMLGFRARWAGGEPSVGDPELEDVRWFTREQVLAGQQGEWFTREEPAEPGPLILPPKMAIARSLLDGWLRAGRRAAR
ncbi:MAG TPA: NAD(+) diphosphatase [Solirubrobacteraceae bacterium]|jgi:NAD+ diphosphatase|nr:NAD(+) diphosphatase [Solirubrobacteraceae bacterium]